MENKMECIKYTIEDIKDSLINDETNERNKAKKTKEEEIKIKF